MNARIEYVCFVKMNNMVARSISKKISRYLNESLFNTNSYKTYFEPIMEAWFAEKSLLTAKAIIKAMVLEREDVISITLAPDAKWKGFKPGQYVQIGIEINGVHYHRIFSISSGITEFEQQGTIRLTIQKQSFGKVTTYIFEHLSEGSYLSISDAMGDFTIDKLERENTLMIAGGVGITPLLSILKTGERIKETTLMYYATSLKPHLMEQELNEVKSLQSNISVQLVNSDKEGFFCKRHLEQYCPEFLNMNILLCGPTAMDSHVRNVLENERFDMQYCYAESFTAAKPLEMEDTQVKEVKISMLKYHQTIHVNNDKTMLELLEDNGMQPKHGCRMGICNQCSCKKVSGVVYNLQDRKLSGTGEEYIKICTTVPVGDIEIDL